MLHFKNKNASEKERVEFSFKKAKALNVTRLAACYARNSFLFTAKPGDTASIISYNS